MSKAARSTTSQRRSNIRNITIAFWLSNNHDSQIFENNVDYIRYDFKIHKD